MFYFVYVDILFLWVAVLCVSFILYVIFVLTLVICILCFILVYHVLGIGIGRFSVDLTMECVVWWILRVISARWLAWYRLSPPVVVDVITDLFCLCSVPFLQVTSLWVSFILYIFFLC